MFVVTLTLLVIRRISNNNMKEGIKSEKAAEIIDYYKYSYFGWYRNDTLKLG